MTLSDYPLKAPFPNTIIWGGVCPHHEFWRVTNTHVWSKHKDSTSCSQLTYFSLMDVSSRNLERYFMPVGLGLFLPFLSPWRLCLLCSISHFISVRNSVFSHFRLFDSGPCRFSACVTSESLKAWSLDSCSCCGNSCNPDRLLVHEGHPSGQSAFIQSWCSQPHCCLGGRIFSRFSSQEFPFQFLKHPRAPSLKAKCIPWCLLSDPPTLLS